MMGPFKDFNAKEIPSEKREAFFVSPKYIQRLYSGTSFIVGERGSGKTTILRYLESLFNKDPSFHMVAVYYRFETAYMKSLYNKRMSEDENIINFSQSICAILCKLICQKLVSLKKTIQFKREKEICYNMVQLIPTISIEELSFQALHDLFEKIRMSTLFNLMNTEQKLLFDFHGILERFAEELRSEEELSNIQICILLDEYENLALFQQKVINSMVKSSSEFVSYRICLRPEGFWTKDTVVEHEHLRDTDDYTMIDYVHEIMGNEVEIQEMLRSVCHSRLQFYFDKNEIQYIDGDLEIDNYLELQTKEAELQNLDGLPAYREQLKTSICQKSGINRRDLDLFSDILDLQLVDILMEKKYSIERIFMEYQTKSKVFNHWKHNYRANALYIVLDECGAEKTYCGFDIILRLANYNLRIVLTILNKCFEGYDFCAGEHKSIDALIQHRAIKDIAYREFDQIGYIPIYGFEVKNLTIALGRIFRKCILDRRARKFEANHFSITTTGLNNPEAYRHLTDVIKSAVIWGVLIQERVTKSKNQEFVFNDKDYILHPIYSVRFQYSYRKKQKINIKDADIIKMFEYTPHVDVRKDFIPGQISISDVQGENPDDEIV